MNKIDLSGEAVFYGLKKYTNWLGGIVIGTWVAVFVFEIAMGKFDRDSTDPPDARSGITLHIDNKSGCHYLGAKRGGLIKRLDKEGHHICEGAD